MDNSRLFASPLHTQVEDIQKMRYDLAGFKMFLNRTVYLRYTV